MDANQQTNKAHRGPTKKTSAKRKLHQHGHNQKAFAVSAPRKLERAARRTNDVNEKRLHVPMVDRTPDDDPPPVIVAVVGPPGTGKTTLIKSLIRRLAKVSLSEVKGPITVVSGKRRRLTFFEVGNDLNSMVDAAKVADLVLLLVDGNFGLEMEVMEFLNIAQHHGMPRVLGIATHLDLFKSQSTLRTSKKRLKHRFWTEVYQGAKLFYLSGVINGRYPDREILNLIRFISVMKFRPLKWRNEHPYLMVDRITDLTHPQEISENPKCDRKVAMYGYIHGTPLPSQNAYVHIAGVGDHYVNSVEKLPDPCPTPYFEQRLEEIEREKAKEALANGEQVAKTVRRRKRLEDKQKIIYAPMSDVGGVLIDKDAVYIDMGSENNDMATSESQKLVNSMQDLDMTIPEKIEEGPGLKLFSTSKEIERSNGSNSQESDDESESEVEAEIGNGNRGRSALRNPRIYGKPIQSNEEYDEEISDENEEDSEIEGALPRSKDFDLQNKYTEDDLEFEENSQLSSDEEDSTYHGMAARLKGSVQRKWDINKILYLDNLSPSDVINRWKSLDSGIEDEEDSDQENDFFKKKQVSEVSEDLDRFVPSYPSLHELKSRFNTDNSEDSDHEYEDGYKILKSRMLSAPKLDDNAEGEDEEGEGEYGDFEDLEADKGNDPSKDDFADFDAEDDENEIDEDEEGEGDEETGDEDEDEDEDETSNENLSTEERRKLNAAKKAKLKLQFEDEEDRDFGADDPEGKNEADTWYDMQKNKMAKQLEVNKDVYSQMDEQTRLKIEGYKAGSYVKIVFDKIPFEFMENFEPEYPIVLGGLLPTESRFGIMNVRIRRHRWHKKILKSQDPLILSLGWRRFQTLPIYTTSDSRTRNRMLKYTPEHAYCFASFYGPLVAPNTTFVAFNLVDNNSTTGSFRVAATGIVQDLNSSVEIVKKLKLVGHPEKIFRNTAFIKDMFTNALEVAKFEGAAIRTVSGIRGEIKRALSSPEGHFRATFEDKILMSDTVFLKTWYPVKVKRFYNPVTSLLLKNHSEWKGMRLTGQVRAEKKLSTPLNPDSAYKKIERQERKFNPLRVPKSIKSSLPFKSQIHEMKPQKKKTYMAKRAVVLGGEEKKARDLMQKIATIRNEKDTKRKVKKNDKFKEKLKELAKKEDMRREKERERKKDFFQKQGKKRSLASSEDSGQAFGSKRRS